MLPKVSQTRRIIMKLTFRNIQFFLALIVLLVFFYMGTIGFNDGGNPLEDLKNETRSIGYFFKLNY